MKASQKLYVGAAVLLISAAIASSCVPTPALAQVPVYEVDATWPKPLLNNWIAGLTLGVHVDSYDQIWVAQNYGALGPIELGAIQAPPVAECCVPAPRLMVFDTDGRVVKTWEGPGEGYVWPDAVHNVFVDHNDFVWTSHYNRHHINKFAPDGSHVLTIGDPDRNGGSNDTSTLGGAAGLYVHPRTNELYVSDGYVNHRVIVFDAETGGYKRHWGAYGERPDDSAVRPYDPDAPVARQFSNVHGLNVSDDDLVYVADRGNNRIQVFTLSGEFVTEKIIAPWTLGSGVAFDIEFSPDPEQTFLYVADGTNMKIRILQRDNLEIVGEFGRAGRQVGQFTRVHSMGIDSRGNIYTAEAADGRRLQKFTPR